MKSEEGCELLAKATQKDPAVASYLENQRRMAGESRAPRVQVVIAQAAPPPECRMGGDGRQVCGYNCQIGSNGRMYCSSVPNGRCAFNSNGTFTCP